MTKYDLACGERKPDSSWIGVDVMETEDVDVVADLRQGIPFTHDLLEKGSGERIRVSHFVEHLSQEEKEKFLLEVKKLAADGCILEVITPYYLSVHAAAGDHKTYYSEVSFKCFTRGHDFPTPKPQFLEREKIEYVWQRRLWVKILRTVLPDGLVKNVPNAVQDIKYTFKVVKE